MKKNEKKKKKRQTKKKEQQKERSQVGARNYLATTFPRARVYRPRCGLATLSPNIPPFPRSTFNVCSTLAMRPETSTACRLAG